MFSYFEQVAQRHPGIESTIPPQTHLFGIDIFFKYFKLSSKFDKLFSNKEGNLFIAESK